MTYANKDEQLHRATKTIAIEFEDLHPTDRAEAFGELSEWAAKRHTTRKRINDHDGVPDRPVLDEVSE